MRAGTTDEIILIGLVEENIARLKNYQPILADLSTWWPGRKGRIAIVYGKTHSEIEQNIAPFTDANTAVSSDPAVSQEESRNAEYGKILICTMGLPRSGKTTWARSQAYPIVNPDSIRLALHGQRFAPEAEPYVWAIAQTMVKSLFLAGHSKVILDACNNTRKRRDQWVCSEWKTFFKTIDTPKHICMQRAKNESDEAIVPVIERMDAEHEHLCEDEQCW